MKAAVYYKYGSPDVIRISDVPKPTPKDGEVLIQVIAASVNAYDWHLVRAKPFFTRALSGVFKPKNHIIGADVAGVVMSVTNGASRFKEGDAVFGCLEGCGRGGLAAGAFAEYVAVKADNLAVKSPALSFSDASALPMAAVTALQAVRDYAKVTQGQTVLVNGASGGVGLFAAQIASAFGAKVTGVCGTDSVNLVRSLGFDTIDYKKESAVKDNVQYDALIDVAATLSVKEYRRALKPGGISVVIGFSTIGHTLSYNLAGKRDGKKIVLCSANNKDFHDLLEVSRLVEDGKIKIIIDSRYPLSQTTEALCRVESGHPKGKVIIEIA